MRRKLLIVATTFGIFLLLIIAAGLGVFFSPLLTGYVEGDAFRIAMEEETAKGLHFPQARYAPIQRTGVLTAQSDTFKADSGQKAMKSLDAHRITATFDPWGMFLRQWRLNDVHVQSGDVEIQIYEAHPEPVKPEPWFAIFLPNTVYLKKIQSDQANITWQFRGERAGFFETQLLITPNGRDFEYVATGGRLKMAVVPDFNLRRDTPGLARIKASTQKRPSSLCPFGNGCQQNGRAVSKATRSARFTGPEKIENWKVPKVHCVFRTGASRMFRF